MQAGSEWLKIFCVFSGSCRITLWRKKFQSIEVGRLSVDVKVGEAEGRAQCGEMSRQILGARDKETGLLKSGVGQA